ncbi:MAG: cytochrome-c peroxidase [Chlorobi bacterium]|nr:cytochrome-c peroxidase [Chlorobiota bacterium]
MNKLVWTLAVLLMLVACKGGGEKSPKQAGQTPAAAEQKDYTELDKTARQLFGALDSVAQNPNNPVTPEKVALGKMLYHDVRLSKDNVQSCNTCHNVNTFGVDNQPVSLGNDGKPGTRNSPTTFNAAFHIAQFWDGREPDVEAQAGGPILNPVEMAMPGKEAVIERISKIKEYREMFPKAFPDDPEPITFDNLTKAIAAYERKLITYRTRFDDYMRGDDNALTPEEKKGMETFINVGCATCHQGPLLGGTMFQKFGIYGNYWDYTKSKRIDLGRYEVTKKEEDKYVFKVPSLRNIEKTYPYFHDGSVASLDEAIQIMAQTQLNKTLTPQQIEEIKTFLKSMIGDVPAELKP